MKRLYWYLFALGLGLAAPPPAAQAQTLIPKPLRYTAGEGSFTFSAGTRVSCNALPDSLRTEAERFIADFNAASGLSIQAADDASAAVVCEVAADDQLGAEGYRLDVTPERITVQAHTSAGFFYAFQSLKMQLPLNVMAGQPDSRVTAYTVPAGEITDRPRFGYRGFMLDCSRHFWTVDELKRMLDVMAYYKMNRFHWHLTDDQGWRFEMPKYPRLTTVGATRQGSYDVDMEYGRYYVSDQYGPYFYTVEDMKEIVAYAAERHIEVIPEVEMPGHMAAAMTAYPEFSCSPYGSHRVWNDGGISSDVLNIGNPEAVQFCKDILDELAEIFPSPYIHIGGDECPSGAWETNPECQALYSELGLTSYRALQSHFTHELAQYMANKENPADRRRLIAWNESVTAAGSDTELLRGDGLTIMCWTGADGASSVAENLGMATILTPQPQYYINRKQSNLPGEVHNAGNGTDCTLEIVYNHQPQIRARTLGVQGTFWCEHVSSDKGLEYQALPRLIALAESAWTPAGRKDFDDFVARLRRDTALLNYRGYTYATHYIVQAGDEEKVMPQAGTDYRLVTRAGGDRAGRCIQLVREGAAIADAAGAQAGKLWSNDPIADPDDPDYAYQMWQFVEDPARPGYYAMVCQGAPEGSVSPTTGTATSSRWSYDYSARHYSFVLGEAGYYGADGDNFYYSIRSEEHSGYYMNSALGGQQWAINVYNDPADGNGGLFTFVARQQPDKPGEGESIADGRTYRIETTAANLAGLRWSDNGGTTLGYARQPWCADAWTVSASPAEGGRQTITLTNAATGRSVSSAEAPVRLGDTPSELVLTYDNAEESFTVADASGRLFIPIGEGYAVNPGTVSPTAGALVPQGSHWRFTEVARVTYRATDTEGRSVGTFTQSVPMGEAYVPQPPVIDRYELLTDPATLTGTDCVTADLSYDVTYRRTAYAATVRAVDPSGNLISESVLTATPQEAQAFTWQVPELPYYAFASASADRSLVLTGDTLITVSYSTDAYPSFAERLEPVTELEAGQYYLIYDNTTASGRNGFLFANPLTRQVMSAYTVEGTPDYVWKLEEGSRGFLVRASNGLYLPMLSSGGAVTLNQAGEMFTFTYDGSDWTIQGVRNGLYFNGNAGSFTGYGTPHPYRIYKFRTEPYYAIRYTCRTEDGGTVERGTYTFFVRAGEPYRLECPVEAPYGYPEMECSEELTSGTMTGNLDVTYTFKKKVIDGIDTATADDDGEAGPWYDLSGRRVLHPTKGVYIRKGQKIILK